MKAMLVALLCAALLGGCKTIPERPDAASYFYDQETALGLEDGDSQRYHALVHYPFELGLRYPGIVVGIEKTGVRTAPLGPGLLNLEGEKPTTAKWLRELLVEDQKYMFISHVLAFNNDTAQAVRPCFLYSAFAPANHLVQRRDFDGAASCPLARAGTGQPWNDSWTAIAAVRDVLSHDVLAGGQYTHVVVVVMGWNTEQSEAMRNFNSIIDRMARTAGTTPFRPFVIGVTWPSQWFSSWAAPLAQALSLPNKANDADEIGAGWLGALLQHGVLPAFDRQAAGRPQLMVLGHSFGARATSHAVCRPSVIRAADGTPGPGSAQVDWLIALQGAYSLHRFTDQGAGYHVDLSYPDHCERARQLVFTASIHDLAAQKAGEMLSEAEFAGTLATFEHALAGGTSTGKVRYATFRATREGELKPVCGAGTDPASRFNYIDASAVIRYNSLGTGGGAHSDIYRVDTANLIWNATHARLECPSH